MNAVSILWGTVPGGVTAYVTSLGALSTMSQVNMKYVVISSRKWPRDKSFYDALNPFDIHIKGRLDPSWRKRICNFIDNIEPDVVMVHGSNGYFVASHCINNCTSRFKVVATYHGRYHPPKINRLPFIWIFNKYAAHFLKYKADKVITLTDDSVSDLVSRGVPSAKIQKIYNGIPDINVPKESRNKLRTEWGIDENDFVVGAISRLDPIKGISFLIQAIKRLITEDHLHLRLILLGDGPQRAELEKLVLDLGLTNNVMFLGHRNDARKYLTAFDLFVLPSLSECHSISLLEAMCANLPIICSDVGGNRETVTHNKDALIVQPRDIAGLAAAIRRVTHDKQLTYMLGLSARKRYENEFTHNIMLRKTADVLLSV